jgi:hypothetical protein
MPRFAHLTPESSELARQPEAIQLYERAAFALIPC